MNPTVVVGNDVLEISFIDNSDGPTLEDEMGDMSVRDNDGRVAFVGAERTL